MTAIGSSVRTCPRCGLNLKSTYFVNAGQWKLACPDGKDCGYTEAEPLDARLRREGHAQLPGFD